MVYEPTESLLLIEELGVCGCGNPSAVYAAIHQMLERVNGGLSTFDSEEETPYICYMAYILSDKDFMEHGSGVSYSWLTTKGKRLLEALREYKKYNYEFLEMQDNTPEYFWREVVE